MGYVATGLHVALLAGSAVTTAILGGYAVRQQKRPGTRSFVGLMAGFTLFSLTHLVGLLTVHPVWRLVWEYLQWTATAIVPLFWLLFAIEYTGYEEVITRRTLAGLAAVPLVTVVFTWTNAYHGLMWPEARVVVTNGLAVLQQPFGPGMVLFIVVSYAMVAIGGLLLIRLVWLSEYLYATQGALLVVGAAAPIVANALTVFGLSPIRNPPLDITPYAFSVTGLVFGYALFGHDLFDLVPATRQIGRDAAIRGLEDGVVIVDMDHTIIYANPAAIDVFDREPAAILGEPVERVIGEATLDFDAVDALAEWDRGDAVYEIRTLPIHDRRERLIGHTLVIQDITARKRRERRLAIRRKELERLDDLNTVIRGVNRALVSATSRAEIEEAVCDRLADSDLYRTVCAGDIPTWNGDADRWTVAGRRAQGDDLLAALDAGGLDSAPAAETPTTTVPDDPPGTWVVVPLAYGRTVYGALGLESAPDAAPNQSGVTDREREILGELGELIGHAINAVENSRLLAAKSVVELEFHSSDTEDTLLGAARAVGCHFEVTGLVPDTNGGHVAYLGVDGGSPAAVAEALTADGAADARVVRADDEPDADAGLVECTVTGATLLGTLIDHGGKLQEATIDVSTAEFVVEVASDADVRSVVERVSDRFPDTSLVAQRERDRSIDEAGSVPGETVSDLTDRQQEALEAAYRAGYFNWPRESTAEEVADTLDITAPTLHAHLRKAESSLLTELFDHEERRRS